MTRIIINIGLFLSALLFYVDCQADIYVYTDPKGVRHFTNVPTSREYKLFIPESRPRLVPTYSPSKFPDTYDDLIQKAAEQYDLCPYLLKSIIKVESNFNPRAVSPKGAMGLMQVMPDTFKFLGMQKTFDPEKNIQAGARFFRMMLDRFGDNRQLALAAYNAGPTTVDQCGRRIPAIPETRNYVDKVLVCYEKLNPANAKKS